MHENETHPVLEAVQFLLDHARRTAAGPDAERAEKLHHRIATFIKETAPPALREAEEPAEEGEAPAKPAVDPNENAGGKDAAKDPA